MNEYPLAKVAREFLRVPFVLGGRSVEGLDCAGLVMLVGKTAGKVPEAYEPPPYGMENDGSFVLEELDRWTVQASEVGEAEIGVFEIKGLRQHLAILSRIPYPDGYSLGMIHAYNPYRTVVEHNVDDKWRGRLVELRRFR